MQENSFNVKFLNGILEEYADKSNVLGKLSRFMLTGGFGSYRYTNEFIDPHKSFLVKEGFLDLNCSTFEKRIPFDFSNLKKTELTELAVKNLNTDNFSNQKSKSFRIESALDFNFIRLGKETSDANLESNPLLEASIIEILKVTDLIDNHTNETNKKIAIFRANNELLVLEKISFETLEFLRSEVQKIDSFFSEYEETLLKYNHLDEPVDVKKQTYMKNILKIADSAFWQYSYRAFDTDVAYDKQFKRGISLKIEKLSKSKEDPKVIFSEFTKYLKELFENMLANELLINNLIPASKLVKDEREIKTERVNYAYELTTKDNFKIDINDFYSALSSSNKALNVIPIENGELVIFKNKPTKDDIVKLVNLAKAGKKQIFFIIINSESEIPRGNLYAVNPDRNVLTSSLQAAGLSKKYDLEILEDHGMLAVIEENKKVELKHGELTLSEYIKKFVSSDSDFSKIEMELLAFRDFLDFPDFLEPIIKAAHKKDINFETILGRHFKFLIENSEEVIKEFQKIVEQREEVTLNLVACLLLRDKEKQEYLLDENTIPVINEAETLSAAFDQLNSLCKGEPNIIKRLTEFKEKFSENYEINFSDLLSDATTETTIINTICDDFIEMLEKAQSSLLNRRKMKNKNKKLSTEIGKIKQRFLSLNVIEYLRLNESIAYLNELEENFEPSPFNADFTPKYVIYSLSKDKMEKLIKLVDVDDLDDIEQQTDLQLAFLQSFAEMRYINSENNFQSLSHVIANFKEKNSKALFRGLIICEKFEQGLSVSNSRKYAYDTDAGIIYAKYES